MIFNKSVRLIAAFAVLGLTILSPVSAGTVIGQTGTNDLFLNGQAVPSGTTLTLDAVLQTGDNAGLAHLNGGNALWLAPGTKIRFSDADLGIAIHVLAGQLAFNSASTGTLTLAPSSVLVLNEQGQVREGTQVTTEMCALESDETAQFCHANPGDSKCSWSFENVANADVQAKLDDGWLTLPSDILDGQCRSKVGGGGLSKGAITGIVLGSVAAGYLAYDEWIASKDQPGS